MFTLTNLVVLAVFIAVVAAVSPAGRRFLRSLMNWGEATANDAANAVNASKAVSIYKNQIENAVENGKEASLIVENASKQLVMLNRQIENGLKDKARLTNRIQTTLDAGDVNHTAEKYAADLDRVEKDLAENQQQKVVAEASYSDNLKLVERFQAQIADARRDATQLGDKLAASQAEKELNQMAASLKDKLNTGEFAESRRRIQDQIDSNLGSSRAIRDLSRQSMAEESDDELERKASAAAVLARFKKPPMGIAPEATATPVGS